MFQGVCMKICILISSIIIRMHYIFNFGVFFLMFLGSLPTISKKNYGPRCFIFPSRFFSIQHRHIIIVYLGRDENMYDIIQFLKALCALFKELYNYIMVKVHRGPL